MLQQNLDTYLPKVAKLVNQRMTELLPDVALFNQSKLATAMRYSALSGGKRIRSFLTINSASIFGVEIAQAIDVACALEFIHVYSLIHDDLPAMDDDDYRRGELSCHKKFDEATAILAGDALLTYAFQILSDQKTNQNPEIRCQIINLIAGAIGFDGMAGGQMLDLEAENKQLSQKQIFELHQLKTGKMFVAAIEAGAILGGANQKQKDALVSYAVDLGLAFQIKDDILDFKESKVRKKPDYASIVQLIGLENAILQLDNLKISAINHLKIFDNSFNPGADLLREVAEFVVSRDI